MNKNIIKISNASVYIDGRKILHDLQLEIPRGRHTFILGPNGSGKTTFVKLLLGHHYPAYGGKIELLGKTFGSANIRELRKHIAVASPLLSDFYLAKHSGIEVVMSGIDCCFGIFREYTNQERVYALELMNKFSISHLEDRKYESMSSGEQIRVLISRALISQPELLILDEPSVFLDPAGRERLLEEINMLPEKIPDITMLFITQRIEDILPCFTHGVLLSDGRIADYGSADKLLTEEKLSNIFKTNIKLIPGTNGRLWSICV